MVQFHGNSRSEDVEDGLSTTEAGDWSAVSRHDRTDRHACGICYGSPDKGLCVHPAKHLIVREALLGVFVGETGLASGGDAGTRAAIQINCQAARFALEEGGERQDTFRRPWNELPDPYAIGFESLRQMSRNRLKGVAPNGDG